MPHTATSTDVKSPTRVGVHRLVRYGLLAAVLAAVANGTILVAALELFGVPAGFPLSWGPVLASSAIPAIGATVTYGAIARVARHPNRPFVLVAAFALAISFVPFVSPPPELVDAPRSVFLTLSLMHVVAAATIAGLLTRVPQPATEDAS